MPFYDDIPEIEPTLEGSDLRMGIVMSRFNSDIGEGLLSACITELRSNGVQNHNILPTEFSLPITKIKRLHVCMKKVRRLQKLH